MPGYLGRFVDSLAGYCQSVICFMHSPRSDEITLMDYPISASNVSLVSIGLHDSVPKRTLLARLYTRYVHQYRQMLDLMLIRGPSPLLPAMAAAVAPVPVALLLVGDYLTGVDDLPQPRWRKEAIRVWATLNKAEQMSLARKSLNFVNSRILYEELKNAAPYLYELRTTTLSKEDFYVRSDTCQHAPPYRILYIGRIEHTKGLLQLVEAVALLVERGEHIVLDLVGWPEKNDPVLDEIGRLSRTLNVESHIHYHGGKSFGPALFEFYRQADIFVVASFAEGFPRTIWEAMAHGLPVVATRVGSIPAFVEDAAELVEPHNSLDLAEAITRLVHDPRRRQYLIAEGQKLANENTLDKRAKEMMQQIQTYLANHSLEAGKR